jgi:hypothetical protein
MFCLCLHLVQTTIEGARNIRSTQEIEQLLGDYPAALELYRTGKYKVKVKCETDVERVILVEKRMVKTKSDQPTVTNVQQEKHIDAIVNDDEITRTSRGRAQSQDSLPPRSSPKATEAITHTASSSIRLASNAQPKVDHHRTSSKERTLSITPPTRADSQQIVTHVQQASQASIHEYPKRMASSSIPYVNDISQQRLTQPYHSEQLLQVKRGQHFYRPLSTVSQQYPFYPQTYFQGQRPIIPSLNQTKYVHYSIVLVFLFFNGNLVCRLIDSHQRGQKLATPVFIMHRRIIWHHPINSIVIIAKACLQHRSEHFIRIHNSRCFLFIPFIKRICHFQSHIHGQTLILGHRVHI